MNKPPTVFKFCSGTGGIAILKNRSIFITSPLDLNDPFEMRPAWTDAHAQRFSEDQQLRNKMMAGMPIHVATKDGIVPSGGFMPTISEQPVVPVDDQRAIADTHNGQVFRLLHENYRVLCFSTGILDIEKPYDSSETSTTLMWSHYADSFQGVCLAFDSTKFENGIHPGGNPVDYQPTRASLPPSFYDVFQDVTAERVELHGVAFTKDPESGILLMAHTRNQLIRDHLIKLLTHKSPAWKYEEEVRMIYDLQKIRASENYMQPRFVCDNCRKTGKSFEACNNPTYRDAIRLPTEAVLAVVFGSDTSKADVETILTLLDSPDFSHVRVYWSSLHSDQYKLQYNRDDKGSRERYSLFMQELRERQTAESKGHVRRAQNVLQLVPAKKTVNYLPRAAFTGDSGDQKGNKC